MPHVVDPHGAGLFRVRLGVDTRGREALLEDGVGEAQVGADAFVEGVVARRDVVVAPAELPRVGCEDADGEAGFEGAFEEGHGQFVVVRHVELVEAGAVAIGCGDVLDRRAAGGAEAVGEVELFGDFGDGEFAERVVDLVDADGSEADGSGDFVPKDRGRGVSDVGVNELARDDAVAEEGLAVGEVGVGQAGIGGGVVPGYRDELLIGGKDSGRSYQPPSVSFCLANSSSLPGSAEGG